MQDNHPKWERSGSKTVYKGRMHIIEYDAILPNGEHTTYEVDHFEAGAVAVLIKVDTDKVILTYQYRFPLDKWIYDLPGGAIQIGETIEEAATRECKEEVGIAPKKVVRLAKFYPNPARTDWPAHVYFCDDFEESKIDLNDPSETVERILMPIAKLKKLIDENKIVDPMLLIAWYSALSKGYINT